MQNFQFNASRIATSLYCLHKTDKQNNIQVAFFVLQYNRFERTRAREKKELSTEFLGVERHLIVSVIASNLNVLTGTDTPERRFAFLIFLITARIIARIFP